MYDEPSRARGFGGRGGALAASLALVAIAAGYAALAESGRRDRAALAYAAMFVPAAYLIRAAWSRDDRRTVFGIVLLALIVRVPLLAADPLWSNDAYRYVWDGRLAARGIDPRSIAPNDPALAAYRGSPLWAHIDLRTIATVYPPATLALFELAARIDPDGVRGAKTIALAGDVLALAVLLAVLRRLGLPRGRAAAYALHPLVLVSFAQDAHVEAFAIAGIVASLSGPSGARIAGLAGAILTKLYPAILVPPAFARDRRGALALGAVVLLANLPSLAGGHLLGSLGQYVSEQRFNPAVFALIGPVGAAAVLLFAIALATLAVRRGAALPGATLAVVTTYLLTTPNVLPWYLAVLPASIVTLREPFAAPSGILVAGIAAWTASVALSYAAPWYVPSGSPAENIVHAVEYSPLAIALGLWILRRR